MLFAIFSERKVRENVPRECPRPFHLKFDTQSFHIIGPTILTLFLKWRGLEPKQSHGYAAERRRQLDTTCSLINCTFNRLPIIVLVLGPTLWNSFQLS